MSGHSKWHKVKHRKAATDSQKSKLFGQLARDIKNASRHGNDPSQNSMLREAIERAKKANLPQANIERLLSADTSNAQSATYEGYGAGGVAILIQTETDNTNRTVSELRSLLKEYGGNLGEPGSVRWKFTELATIQASPPPATARDDLELSLIEAGALDIVYTADTVTVNGQPDARVNLETTLQRYAVPLKSSEVTVHVPDSQKIHVAAQHQRALAELFAALAERDDVVAVFTDLANPVD